MDYKSKVLTIRGLNSNTMKRFGPTAIEALDPLRLVSIFYTLNDIGVPAEPSNELVSPLDDCNHEYTYACMRVLTLSKGYCTAISMTATMLGTRDLRKLFERA